MMKHQAVVFKIIGTAWFLGIGCIQFICRAYQFDLNGRIFFYTVYCAYKDLLQAVIYSGDTDSEDTDY